ncbi:hypothetical protein REPUB_Repub13aG0115400 [Reevesia pubescens]
MGFFTDAYDLFCITAVTKLIGRLYYYDSTNGKPGAFPQGKKCCNRGGFIQNASRAALLWMAWGQIRQEESLWDHPCHHGWECHSVWPLLRFHCYKCYRYPLLLPLLAGVWHWWRLSCGHVSCPNMPTKKPEEHLLLRSLQFYEESRSSPAWDYHYLVLAGYIAFYSLQLTQNDVYPASGLLDKASSMNAIEETFQLSKAKFLIALSATVPGYWFIVFLIDRIDAF